MKKIILTLAVCICAAATASAQNWAVGGRVGAGFQAQGEYALSDKNYVEARFGMNWCQYGSMLTADFTALYNWNVLTMDWTPSAGEWFFDAGVGLGVGGRAHYAYVGAAGQAKLGIKLSSVPLKISVDWTPVIGANVFYGMDKCNSYRTWLGFYKQHNWDGDYAMWQNGKFSKAGFHAMGLANIGVSCVYYF